MEEKRFCYNCGQEIDSKAFICVHCGVKQPGWLSSKAGITEKK